jgi:CRP/FNR family transcriptional regulator
MKLKKGSILFDEHSTERNLCIYYLLEGICSVSGISSNDKEQIFLYQRAGEILGHVPYLLDPFVQTHPYAYRRPTILAKTTCIFYEVPHEYFLNYLHQYPEISLYVNQQMAHNYSMTLAHLKQMQEDSVVSGLCRFLLQVSVLSKEQFVIPKMFTYSEISKFLGVHEVTVSRIMGRLKQEGFLTKVSSGLLITDNKKLEQIIREPDTFKYK